mgnify:CR=1 FL=1
MKKVILFIFITSLTSLSASEFLLAKDSLVLKNEKVKISLIEQMAISAILSENYESIEQLLQSGKVNSRMKVDGKPLIIHAAIHDKAEMILLLARYGAMLIEPLCDEGKSIMEYAIENKSIHAQAQIILIRA